MRIALRHEPKFPRRARAEPNPTALREPDVLVNKLAGEYLLLVIKPIRDSSTARYFAITYTAFVIDILLSFYTKELINKY